MIPAEKNPLTPRETALRMLEHMHDDVSYEDIVRQLRILQDIENTLNDVEMAGFPADDAVEEARNELEGAGDDERSFRSAMSSLVLHSRPDSEHQNADATPVHENDTLLRKATWYY